LAFPVAGFIADKFTTSRTILWLLVLMALSLFLFAFIRGSPKLFYLLLFNSLAIGCQIYALRGIYYALLEEGKIPAILTGSATGLISLVAYTPDVFIPFLAGRLLDKYTVDGLGYRYFFLILGIFSVTGVVLTAIFRRAVRSKVRVPIPRISDSAIPES
jgi:sugar phosphate permease